MYLDFFLLTEIIVVFYVYLLVERGCYVYMVGEYLFVACIHFLLDFFWPKITTLLAVTNFKVERLRPIHTLQRAGFINAVPCDCQVAFDHSFDSVRSRNMSEGY